MHWFWRAGIAATVGTICGGVLILFASMDSSSSPGRIPNLIVIGFYLATPAVTSLLFYGMLTRLSTWPEHAAETRCRKCRYILRGITEPRCPECGERI